MKGNEVKSSKWSDASVVFDDGEFSAVWGRYDGGKRKVLGLRWNHGEGEIGFPSSFGHPAWFVVPSEITGAVLASLLERVYKGGPSIGDADTLALAYKDYFDMATLAMINGILIRMKPEKNGKHHRAHIFQD